MKLTIGVVFQIIEYLKYYYGLQTYLSSQNNVFILKLKFDCTQCAKDCGPQSLTHTVYYRVCHGFRLKKMIFCHFWPFLHGNSLFEAAEVVSTMNST